MNLIKLPKNCGVRRTLFFGSAGYSSALRASLRASHLVVEQRFRGLCCLWQVAPNFHFVKTSLNRDVMRNFSPVKGLRKLVCFAENIWGKTQRQPFALLRDVTLWLGWVVYAALNPTRITGLMRFARWTSLTLI